MGVLQGCNYEQILVARNLLLGFGDRRVLYRDGTLRPLAGAAHDGVESGAYRIDGILHLEGSPDEAHCRGDMLRGGRAALFCREPRRIDRGTERRIALDVCRGALPCYLGGAPVREEPRNGGLAHHGSRIRAFGGILQEPRYGFRFGSYRNVVGGESAARLQGARLRGDLRHRIPLFTDIFLARSGPVHHPVQCGCRGGCPDPGGGPRVLGSLPGGQGHFGDPGADWRMPVYRAQTAPEEGVSPLTWCRVGVP